ncbi:MAG: hypothetical protein ACK444_08155, partial [Flavobacteriales bacterium]
MRFLVYSCFLVLPVMLSAQGSFYKQYSGTEYDRGHGVVQLPDSSYALTGVSGSWGDNAEAFLLKISKSGDYQWSQHYGGYEFDEGRRILFDPIHQYFIVGSSLENPNSAYDAYLL